MQGKGNDLLEVGTTRGSGIKLRYAEQSGALPSKSVGVCKIRKSFSWKQRVKNVNVLYLKGITALRLGIRFGKLQSYLPFVQAVVKAELSESRDIKQEGH